MPGVRRVREVRCPDGTLHGYAVRCPACDAAGLGHAHVFAARTADGRGWSFNGDVERPTFSPSMLATCTYGEDGRKTVCHSFVRDGRVEYLADCTHALAGQTIDLPAFEDP